MDELFLIHSAKGTTWTKKGHSYIKKYKGPNGKWVYVYSQSVLQGPDYKKEAQGTNLDSNTGYGKNKKEAMRKHMKNDMYKLRVSKEGRDNVREKGWTTEKGYGNEKFFDEEAKYNAQRAMQTAKDLRKEKESSFKHKTLKSLSKYVDKGREFLKKYLN